MVCESLDSLDRFIDCVEGTDPNCATGDDVEPDLHLVEPRRIGLCEFKLEAWMSGQPLLYLGVFVDGVVIDLDVQIRTTPDLPVPDFFRLRVAPWFTRFTRDSDTDRRCRALFHRRKDSRRV